MTLKCDLHRVNSSALFQFQQKENNSFFPNFSREMNADLNIKLNADWQAGTFLEIMSLTAGDRKC